MKILTSMDDTPATRSNIISVRPFHFRPEQRNWTDQEVKFLQENYPHLRNDELVKRLNRSEGGLVRKAMKLQLRKEGIYWTPAEVQFLKVNYTTLSMKELTRCLNRSENSNHKNRKKGQSQ